MARRTPPRFVTRTMIPTIAAIVLISAAAARAQDTVEPRVSAEAVVSATMFSSYTHVSGVLDVTGSVRVGEGMQLIARPWAWRRPDGTSVFQMYQLQMRYVSRTRTPVRVDGGVITSPLGLNPLQMRADLNPLISPVPYYVIPLPRFERSFDALQPLTSGYPLGLVVSTSGTRWDVRGGVLDTTPARPGIELKHDGRGPLPQVVFGGGVTPRPGLRIGGGLAHGRYRDGSESVAEGVATVANLEAEFTVNHTRLSGEWVVDRFQGSTGTATAQSFYVQGVQTITPRLYGAARFSHVSTPPVFVVGHATAWTTAETTAGVRLTPDWTLRVGYLGQCAYFGEWQHQAGVSIVWDARWFR